MLLPVFFLRPGQSWVGSHCELLFHSTFIAVMKIHLAEFSLNSTADFGRVLGAG